MSKLVIDISHFLANKCPFEAKTMGSKSDTKFILECFVKPFILSLDPGTANLTSIFFILNYSHRRATYALTNSFPLSIWRMIGAPDVLKIVWKVEKSVFDNFFLSNSESKSRKRVYHHKHPIVPFL